MRGVATLMQAQGAHDAVLVSDPFHMLRLELVSDRLGLTAYPSPTRTSPISASREARWRYLLSESFKVPFTIVVGGRALAGARK
jgi:uncharacterized SAM-binding protein YcdF (DUF218 family)